MKYIKVPTELTQTPYNHRALKIDGFSVVESCSHITRSQGAMFLEEHLLLFVTQGQNVLTYGNATYTVKENQMILFPKACLLNYDKTGDPKNGRVYDSLMFFLKDELILDFFKHANISSQKCAETAKITAKPIKPRMMGFLESVKPYFDAEEEIDPGLIKIKLLEVLYDIAGTDKQLLQQILQIKQPVKTDLVSVMEDNYNAPISIPELAYISGRSLASFKRDFKAIFNIPPSEWIRKRRLEKAKELLENTLLTVSEICYTTGFENPTHFSRIFKDHFGITPSDCRIEV